MGLTRGNKVMPIIAVTALMLLALAVFLPAHGLVGPLDQMMTEFEASAA
jgi:hypothetical protein